MNSTAIPTAAAGARAAAGVDHPDPRDTLASNPMSRLQVLAVAVTVGLNALDGFDVLSISFASPGIAREWGIDRAALGVVLSMELIGMALGSVLIGFFADKAGRRTILLACLGLMSAAMFFGTTSTGVGTLAVWRVITGLGIGGVLATCNAVAAEFANSRRRDLCIAMTVIGYPIGAVVGGMISAYLLKAHDWRSVFYLGASMSALFIPITFFLVPESVNWLCRIQPRNALAKINHTLARMGRGAIASLPGRAPPAAPGTVTATSIFSKGLLLTTLIATLAYFFHVITFYYTLKWIPKIVVDMGFAASSAALVLVWANVGGAAGGAVFGLLSQRIPVMRLTMLTMLASTALVTGFGFSPANLTALSAICAAAGFCTNGAMVGLYAILARAFPTQVRASGTGFVIGVGRGGSIVGPVLAGYLFKSGLGLPGVSSILAVSSSLAAVTLLVLGFLRPGVGTAAQSVD